MARMYRAGIIGFGHMHINDVAEHFRDNAQIEWVAFCKERKTGACR